MLSILRDQSPKSHFLFSHIEIDFLAYGKQEQSSRASPRGDGRPRKRPWRHTRLYARPRRVEPERYRGHHGNAGGNGAPLSADARGAGLRHAQRPSVSFAPESAGTRSRIPRVDEYRIAHQDASGGSRPQDRRFGGL